MSLATIVGPSATGPEGRGWAAVVLEQAAARAATTTSPSVATRRFMTGSSVMRRVGWEGPDRCRSGPRGRGLGAGLAGRRAAAELRAEERELALDDVERVAVHAGEVDRQQGDQRDFDRLGDVGRRVV